MATRIGRVVLETPEHIGDRLVPAENPGIAGPFTEDGALLRGFQSATTVAAIIADLRREARRGRLTHVHCEDDDALFPTGYYRVDDHDVEHPGGSKYGRHWNLTLRRKTLPMLVRQAWSDRLLGTETADSDYTEAKRVDYTPETTERAVLKLGSSVVLLLRLEANANDFSGLGNNGALVGAPPFVAAKIGNGVDLNGSTQYITVADSPTLNQASKLTIEFWVKPDVVTAGQALLCKGATIAAAQYSVSIQASGKLRFIGGGNNNHDSATGLTAGQWAHVVVTYDSRTVKIYINGVLDATSTNTGDLGSGGMLGIGANNVGEEKFDGVIDELRLCAKVLTDAEVKRRFDQTTGGSRPSNDERAPHDEPLNLPKGTWKALLRAVSTVTATQKFRLVTLDKDGVELDLGAQVTAAAADQLLDIDLPTFPIQAANEERNMAKLLVQGVGGQLNPVRLGEVFISPA